MSDIDALLAEVDGKKPAAKSGEGGAMEDAAAALKAAKAKAEAEAAAALADMGLDDAGGGGGGKKRRRKKKKGKGAAADGGGEASPAAGAGAASPAAAEASEPAAKGGKSGKSGKGKKMTAAKLAMLKRKEEQERRKAEEEAERKAEEEARRAEEEAARLAEEEKERKRAEREAKVAELKRQGKYKSKGQLKRERAAKARVEAMVASGMRVAGLGDDRSEEEIAAEEKAKAEAAAAAAARAKEAAEKKAAEEKAKAEAEARRKELLREDAWKDVASGAGGPAAGEEDDDDEDEDWEDLVDDEEEKAEREEAERQAALAEAEAEKAKMAEAKAARGRGAAASDAAAGLDLEERIARSRERRAARRKEAKETRSADRLRSPICCVLGHVDTGKTSLLDKIRRTDVQGAEAGGITQQIGATYFPMERLRSQTDKINKDLALEYRLPGLLVVDTPGHESFTNLRTRGSNLCDIAVLVVDIMHGLEPQTLESLDLLRRSRTPFVVALNKVDRVYGWEASPGAPLRETLATQKSYSVNEFETRVGQTIAAFSEQGLNAKLYYENDDFKSTVSLVPTSAVTGEGIPDLLMLITQLTQQLMSHRLMFTPSVQCSVLEVKAIPGLGTTIDVCLTNGELHEGDEIVVCGMNGAIHTTVRALLTPPPAREIRVGSDYVRNETITAAMGIKISANDLDKAVAGTQLLVVHRDDEIEDLKREVQKDLDSIMGGFATDSIGVHVQASTLGSLEALLEYLRTCSPPVPVASVAIGPVHKRDVMQCAAMLERAPEYAMMLCFDVPMTAPAAEEAASAGVRHFEADIIYHLTDAFERHLEEARARKRAEAAVEVAFPVSMKILDAFNAKNPLVLGVQITAGVLRKGTPLCCTVGFQADGVTPMVLELGRVTSIQRNHTETDKIGKDDPPVAIKIEGDPSQANIAFGRHFDKKNAVHARLTRRRIDILKREFRDDLSKEEWACAKSLKAILGIP